MTDDKLPWVKLTLPEEVWRCVRHQKHPDHTQELHPSPQFNGIVLWFTDWTKRSCVLYSLSASSVYIRSCWNGESWLVEMSSSTWTSPHSPRASCCFDSRLIVAPDTALVFPSTENWVEDVKRRWILDHLVSAANTRYITLSFTLSIEEKVHMNHD